MCVATNAVGVCLAELCICCAWRGNSVNTYLYTHWRPLLELRVSLIKMLASYSFTATCVAQLGKCHRLNLFGGHLLCSKVELTPAYIAGHPRPKLGGPSNMLLYVLDQPCILQHTFYQDVL